MKLIKYYKPTLQEILTPGFIWSLWDSGRNKIMDGGRDMDIQHVRMEDVLKWYKKNIIVAREPILTMEYKNAVENGIPVILRFQYNTYASLEKDVIVILGTDFVSQEIDTYALTYQHYLRIESKFNLGWDATFFRDLRYIYGMNNDPSNQVYKYYLPEGYGENEDSIIYFYRMCEEKDYFQRWRSKFNKS